MSCSGSWIGIIAISETDICDKYKVGKCPHGFKGTKLIDDKPCLKSHPPKCNKYLRFGSKGTKGCKEGKECKYFHPTLCKFSLKSKSCFNLECSFPHLKGTQRDPDKKQRPNSRNRDNSQQQRDNSQQRPSRNADKTKSAVQTKPPPTENHFLEIKKMVEQMTTRIQAMESRVSQYQMIQNLPSVPHHSFMPPPHSMSLIHPSHTMQTVPPAFYTPQFSS